MASRFAALSFACLVACFSAPAATEPSSLRDRIIAAVPGLSCKSEEVVPPAEVADAVLSVTDNRRWVALLLAIGAHESGFRKRIAEGHCKRGECDGGRAWGLWQVHKSLANRDVWGSQDLALQAREASRVARGAFGTCRKSAVPFPLSTFRAYAGAGCERAVHTEDFVVVTVARLLRRL